MQNFRTSYSTWQHQTIQGIFLPVFISVLPTKRQGILSHVFPSDVYWLQKSPSSLPHSPCKNVTACFCKRQMAWFISEEFLSWNVQKPANLLNTLFLIWHMGQVLAPEGEYVHLCETLLSYCQSPAEREPHWPVRRKKCYFHCSDSSGCCRQDRLCSVDMEVCDLSILRWCGSLRMQRASEESWQLHQTIF